MVKMRTNGQHAGLPFVHVSRKTQSIYCDILGIDNAFMVYIEEYKKHLTYYPGNVEGKAAAKRIPWTLEVF